MPREDFERKFEESGLGGLGRHADVQQDGMEAIGLTCFEDHG